jgi:hypothetical protein
MMMTMIKSEGFLILAVIIWHHHSDMQIRFSSLSLVQQAAGAHAACVSVVIVVQASQVPHCLMAFGAVVKEYLL